jgi:hypothetical protein
MLLIHFFVFNYCLPISRKSDEDAFAFSLLYTTSAAKHMDVKTSATFLGNSHRGEGDQIVGQCVGSRAIFVNAQITCCNGIARSATVGTRGGGCCDPLESCATTSSTDVATQPLDESSGNNNPDHAGLLHSEMDSESPPKEDSRGSRSSTRQDRRPGEWGRVIWRMHKCITALLYIGAIVHRVRFESCHWSDCGFFWLLTAWWTPPDSRVSPLWQS